MGNFPVSALHPSVHRCKGHRVISVTLRPAAHQQAGKQLIWAAWQDLLRALGRRGKNLAAFYSVGASKIAPVLKKGLRCSNYLELKGSQPTPALLSKAQRHHSLSDSPSPVWERERWEATAL